MNKEFNHTDPRSFHNGLHPRPYQHESLPQSILAGLAMFTLFGLLMLAMIVLAQPSPKHSSTAHTSSIEFKSPPMQSY